MRHNIDEVLEFVRENDVKFIRLAFCDILGTQKNISILYDELERAFRDGISFDGSAILGFMNVEKSDLLLYPDPSTLSILPWRPQQGCVVRFFCDIKYPDGTIFEADCRNILKAAVARAAKMGYTPKVGAECEFYLFLTDDNGNPTKIPFDNGGYLDVSPLDKGENIRREICLILEQMGIKPESSHHEQGPGQHEIDFKYDDAVISADNFITLKNVVRTVAQRNGLFASFMPKPLWNQSGNGLHINLSLTKNGFNIFETFSEHSSINSQEAESFAAGILVRIAEITAFTNPLTNSYARFGEFKAPQYISWSLQNRSQLIRIPAAAGEYKRMELRSADPTCNPYLAFALILHAGLDGIEQELKLAGPTDFNLYTADSDKLKDIPALPDTLKKALKILEESHFAKSILGEELIKKYLAVKKEECRIYDENPDKQKIEHVMYFGTA